ncbi:hypothetical protein BC828DRAFT_373374 [Blastocladiella britannica]|nr:hypothetical protein BC828DRAFT_373374 [Blastocladiella britannica]
MGIECRRSTFSCCCWSAHIFATEWIASPTCSTLSNARCSGSGTCTERCFRWHCCSCD